MRSKAAAALCAGIATLAVAGAGAVSDPAAAADAGVRVRAIASPAGPKSGQVSLVTAPDGRVFLSWVEPAGDAGHDLRYAILAESGWTAPATVARGAGWFVNWADFPALAILPDGSMAAHWLERSGPDTYAYDVRITRSFDGGATWSAPFTPHRDSTQTEHGFVSMFPAAGGALGAIWLDGREMTPGDDGHGHGAMTLRYGAFGKEGPPVEEAVLDAMVCECCQTSAAVAADGPVVVYRDRSDGEVRDISIVRRTAGGWSAPTTVASDGWKIEGCPVNGPAIDARDTLVVVAWFTAARDTPRVKLAFSTDGGASFGAPVVIDDGAPSGRVDVALAGDGTAMVTWLERVGGAGEVRARRVSPTDGVGPAMTIAPSGTARSSGFPRMTISGNELVVAWIGSGSEPGVRTAAVTLR